MTVILDFAITAFCWSLKSVFIRTMKLTWNSKNEANLKSTFSIHSNTIHLNFAHNFFFVRRHRHIILFSFGCCYTVLKYYQFGVARPWIHWPETNVSREKRLQSTNQPMWLIHHTKNLSFFSTFTIFALRKCSDSFFGHSIQKVELFEKPKLFDWGLILCRLNDSCTEINTFAIFLPSEIGATKI